MDKNKRKLQIEFYMKTIEKLANLTRDYRSLGMSSLLIRNEIKLNKIKSRCIREVLRRDL